MVAGQVAGPARRYHQRLLAEAYATCGRRAEPCYRAALAFLGAEARSRADGGGDPPALLRQAVALAAHDPEDPLVCGVLALRLSTDEADRQLLVALLRRAALGGERRGYAASAMWPFPFHLASLLGGVPANAPLPGASADEREQLLRTGCDLLVMALEEAVTVPMEKRLLAEAILATPQLRPAVCRQLAARVAVSESIDPWFAWWLAGRADQAAAEVPWPPEAPRGRRLTRVQRRLLTRANECYQRAWELHPEYPWPASELVATTALTDGPAAARAWFDRAVKAQFDYVPAYENLLCALRASGRHANERLLAFGRECLATARFDTAVPLQYARAALHGDRAAPWQSSRAAAEWDQLLAGYRSAPATDAGRQALTLVCPAALARVGRTGAADGARRGGADR